jgi:hypothetical protein
MRGIVLLPNIGIFWCVILSGDGGRVQVAGAPQ